MNYTKHFALLLLVLISIIGCESTTEPEVETEITNSSGQPMPNFSDASNFDGIMATISYEIATVPGMPAVGLTMGYSQFGSMVDAGKVTVNNNELGKNDESGKVFYMSPGVGSLTGLSDVYFNASAHNWSVSGGNGISTLSGNVTSPRNFSVTSPTSNSTVSKSNDLTVSWSGGSSSSTENILIVLVGLSDSKTAFTAQELGNSGSYTIKASDLSKISGSAMLQVVKYNYDSISNSGKDYFMVSEIVKVISLTIN